MVLKLRIGGEDIKALWEMTDNQGTLEKGLKENGGSHKNYRMYTSMDRALEFLLSGVLILGDGQKWNDKLDRNNMKRKEAFAACLSYSTSENIAMWMLYSGDNGKNGAVLNFFPSVIKAFTKLETIELGRFEDDKNQDKTSKEFKASYELSAASKDFKVFLTDVVYIEELKNKVRLSYSGNYKSVDREMLAHKDIFFKKYPWSYEQECRLVVRLSDEWQMKAVENDLSNVRLKLPKDVLAKMKEDRLIRSPIYSGLVGYGVKSSLTGEVDW